MPKTDKELTAEISIAYITSWNSDPHTQTMKMQDVLDVIKSIYETVHLLDSEEK